MMLRIQRLACALAAVMLWSGPAIAQTFTRITTGNPIVTNAVPSTAQYAGCAWVDFDGDGDQDLYIVQQGLYRNDGSGTFVKLAGVPADPTQAVGCSWADADNDGDPDLYISGGPPGGSWLDLNNGDETFTRATGGTIGDGVANQGWGCAWGDYDGDGLVDLVIAAAYGFLNIETPNHLLHNEGGGVFTRLDTSAVCAAHGPYTVPSWNDVDDDGDLDLFIASGPANGSFAPDYLYRNQGPGPGGTFFERITTGVMATESNDGQLYNWVDIDGDGDLDCYLTNYHPPGQVNKLYRNDGGVFVKLSAAEAGPIVTDAQASLASVWGDFDNDGDMDCVVTNDNAISLYYTNDGSGSFTSVNPSALRATGPHYGAAAADYDGDGDLDLYMHGNMTTRGLYRNDSPGTNGWVDVRCVGTASNRSAIGAKVRVRVTIQGVPRNLVQLVSAQNSFNGHNPFLLHFGTGDAAFIDSVVVTFPNGVVQALAHMPTRQTIGMVEGAVVGIAPPVVPTAGGARLEWLGGNPVTGRLRLAITSRGGGAATLRVVDPAGRVVIRRDIAGLAAGREEVDLGSSASLPSGVYWVHLAVDSVERTLRVAVIH